MRVYSKTTSRVLPGRDVLEAAIELEDDLAEVGLDAQRAFRRATDDLGAGDAGAGAEAEIGVFELGKLKGTEAVLHHIQHNRRGDRRVVHAHHPRQREAFTLDTVEGQRAHVELVHRTPVMITRESSTSSKRRRDVHLVLLVGHVADTKRGAVRIEAFDGDQCAIDAGVVQHRALTHPDVHRWVVKVEGDHFTRIDPGV